MNLWQRAVCIVAVVLLTATAASAQNLLVNPSFDDPPLGVGAPPPGWIAFGNVFAEPSVPPQFVPLSGPGLCSMFGSFTGGFNVSGIFQEYVATPGTTWLLSSNARHWSGDAMTGIGAGSCTPNCTDNWVVQKIAFFDAGNNEIGAAESVILDGTYATDVWHPAAAITGTAPAGTVKVQALILYLQPLFAGGAAHIDDVVFGDASTVVTEPSTWGKVKALYE
ncbi:MAG: hypothetical protein JSW50_07525 [Candidatus Latescibacterota bacterium]|nr:MAG: hypothetical protein JSW50_07525 [Candidatus Latescibacterota bacterium]